MSNKKLNLLVAGYLIILCLQNLHAGGSKEPKPDPGPDLSGVYKERREFWDPYFVLTTWNNTNYHNEILSGAIEISQSAQTSVSAGVSAAWLTGEIGYSDTFSLSRTYTFNYTVPARRKGIIWVHWRMQEDKVFNLHNVLLGFGKKPLYVDGYGTHRELWSDPSDW